MLIIVNADDDGGKPGESISECIPWCKDIIRLAEDHAYFPDDCRIRLLFNGRPVLIKKDLHDSEIIADIKHKSHLISTGRNDLLVRLLKEQKIFLKNDFKKRRKMLYRPKRSQEVQII